MVRVSYLGPNASTRMKLRRAYVDLREDLQRCTPLGPEYRTIEALLLQINATCLALFKEPVAEPMKAHVANPGPQTKV